MWAADVKWLSGAFKGKFGSIFSMKLLDDSANYLLMNSEIMSFFSQNIYMYVFECKRSNDLNISTYIYLFLLSFNICKTYISFHLASCAPFRPTCCLTRGLPSSRLMAWLALIESPVRSIQKHLTSVLIQGSLMS